ncbi:MAG: sugar kinase [Gemmobacter sp.]
MWTADSAGRRPKVACIGEVMIELSRMDLAGGTAHVGFAGDTFNTAVYLARLGQDVSYVTNLGRDAFSDRMLAILADEGIDSGLVGRHDTRLPGLYSIETDAGGERSFRYWRDGSAARTLFSGVGADLADLDGFDVVYLSGITLAILPGDVRTALTDKAGALKAEGRQILFDTNHRPRLWPDEATARASFDAMWAATTIALPSCEDEQRLYPGLAPQQVIDRIAALGPVEVVLKNGAQGPLIRANGQTGHLELPRAAQVVDTSGAGDSFNAGYLAARLQGLPPQQAAGAGHCLASTVIGHHGAIIPRAAMPV